jgi:hypothetical protein
MTDITVGFVLLTHNNSSQALRLVSRLNSMFDQPPIAWHHDFTFSSLPLESITKNISLVVPHIKTEWAKFSVLEAMMMAVEQLFNSQNPPDWFVLLSGSDYPIKPANTIVHDLARSSFDVHISHQKIAYNEWSNDWQKKCYDRYHAVKFRVPFVNKKLNPVMRTIRIRHPAVTKHFAPFLTTFPCFAGEFWFCANRVAAEYLINFHKTKPKLANYHRICNIFPEESYHHTIFVNSVLQISHNNWRYVDWSQSEGSAHPKTLLMEDFTRLHESTAHFARKFDANVDEEILNAMDECILG